MPQLSSTQLWSSTCNPDEERTFNEQNDSCGYKIVPLEQKYVDGAVEMHVMAFREFFLAQLGRGFLREFYSQAVGHDLSVGYVAVNNLDEVVGASFGVTDPRRFYKNILRRRWWAFALKSVWPVIKSPKIIFRLFRGLRHRGNVPPCEIKPLGSLLSLGVRPEYQGQGVAVALMRSVCTEFVRKGINAIFLTTDAANNDRVRGFYTAKGWDVLGYYVTPERRKMCWYLWQNPEDVPPPIPTF